MIFSRIKAAYFAIEFLISILLVVFFMWLFKKHIHVVRKIWGRSQRFFGFYSLEVVGNFDERANMIIMNHQSMLDIVVLEEVYPKNLCWIAKKEIADLPVLGQIIHVPIFPEGTRSHSKELLPFKGGAKIIADKLNLKIQPIVITGSDILDVKNFSFKSGKIKIICLDLIDTADPEWLENARAKMQETLDSERQKSAV